VKLARFELAMPESVLDLCARLDEHGDDAKVVAGGQSLIPLMAFRLARPQVLLDARQVPDLSSAIKASAGHVSFGALVTHREAERWLGPDWAGAIGDGMRLLGHPSIRNRGTVGGSLAHADPAAEWPALALALDASVRVVGPSSERVEAADDLFQGWFTTSLASSEVITEMMIPVTGRRTASALAEMARRRGDFALAGSVVRVSESDGTITDPRVVVFAVGSRPVRLRSVEATLQGGDPARPPHVACDAVVEAVRECCAQTTDTSIDRYRVERLLPALISDAITAACERLSVGRA
jgi:carbon-monoxide dehydrogenase medium subunit